MYFLRKSDLSQNKSFQIHYPRTMNDFPLMILLWNDVYYLIPEEQIRMGGDQFPGTQLQFLA